MDAAEASSSIVIQVVVVEASSFPDGCLTFCTIRLPQVDAEPANFLLREADGYSRLHLLVLDGDLSSLVIDVEPIVEERERLITLFFSSRFFFAVLCQFFKPSMMWSEKIDVFIEEPI
ncbi:MLO-like protein 9 isoform X2 [Iris pallida]|nr:MLO-like protein 9 isoform X2 [Iris pallida]